MMLTKQRAGATVPAADLMRARDFYDPKTSIVATERFRGAWFHDTEGNLLAVTRADR